MAGEFGVVLLELLLLLLPVVVVAILFTVVVVLISLLVVGIGVDGGDAVVLVLSESTGELEVDD